VQRGITGIGGHALFGMLCQLALEAGAAAGEGSAR
jgi:hypothetical protein